MNHLNELAHAILRQADPVNRERIDRDHAALNADWAALIARFETRREALAALQQQWEDFENKLHAFETQTIRLDERTRNVDGVVRSRRQLEDTKHVIQVSARGFCFIATN